MIDFSYLVAEVDARIKGELAAVGIVEPLKSAVEYSLFPGGKRIRPLLLLVLRKDLNSSYGEMLPAAVGLEFFHCSSLIHDDLPSLDNDSMRRGKPSCHKAFGEATAILAGDYLIAFAFKVAARIELHDSAEARVTSIMADTFMRLCDGQQLDLLSAEGNIDIAQMHSLKTGALFSACCEIASLGIPSLSVHGEAFSELGYLIGQAFQIGDDFLDRKGSVAEKGRPTGSDVKNNKHNFFSQEGDLQVEQVLAKKFSASRARINNKIESIERDAQVQLSGMKDLLNQTFSRFEAI